MSTEPQAHVYETHVISVDAWGGTPATLEKCVRDAVLAHFRKPSERLDDSTMIYVHVETPGVLESREAQAAFRARMDAFKEELDGREGQDGIISISHLVVEFDTKPTIGAPLPAAATDVVAPLRRTLRRAGVRVATAILRDEGDPGDDNMRLAGSLLKLLGSVDDPSFAKLPAAIRALLEASNASGASRKLKGHVATWADAHAAASDDAAKYEAVARFMGGVGNGEQSVADERRRQAADRALARFEMPAFSTEITSRDHLRAVAHRLGVRVYDELVEALQYEDDVSIDEELYSLQEVTSDEQFFAQFGEVMGVVERGIEGDSAKEQGVRDLVNRAWSAIEPLGIFVHAVPLDDLAIFPIAQNVLKDALVEVSTVLGAATTLHDDAHPPYSLPFWPFELEQAGQVDPQKCLAELAVAAVTLQKVMKKPPEPEVLAKMLDAIGDGLAVAERHPITAAKAKEVSAQRLGFVLRLGKLAGLDLGVVSKAADEGTLKDLPGFAKGLAGKLHEYDWSPGGDDDGGGERVQLGLDDLVAGAEEKPKGGVPMWLIGVIVLIVIGLAMR